MSGALKTYRTAVVNDAGATVPNDLGALFPTVIPAVELAVYEHVLAATQAHTVFPSEGSGLAFPVVFNVLPQVSLYRDKDGSYTVPAGPDAGQPIPPIPVVRGWPPFPGAVPSIGVAEASSEDDGSEDTIQGGFAGDVTALDGNGNPVATCAYYAEPLLVTIVVELIHVNRDERDRLHDQLRRVIFPLKHLLPERSSQIRHVRLSAEKQDLPQDELPRPIYVSLWTLAVGCEALIPTEITASTTISAVTVTPTVTNNPAALETAYAQLTS